MASPTALTRAIRLELASAAWALIEAAGAIIAGMTAGSLALVAFGADSAIEMLSALIVLAQLRRRGDDRSIERALKIVAILFFALALYVVVAAVVTVASSRQPESSPLGIVIAASSVILMPLLAAAKRAAGSDLRAEGHVLLGRLLRADATETALCAVLGVSTLVGIVASTALGWWWADPAASLVVVYFAIREGSEAWRGDMD